MTYSHFPSFLGSNLTKHGAVFAAFLLAVGCGGSSNGDGSGGTAGVGGNAGSAGSAGSTATGGSSATGGSTATGGSSATGGSAATGGSESGGTGGAIGGSGGAAGAGTGGTGGTAECVEQMGSGGFTQPECSDLDRLVVQNPRLDPSGGITPGSKATFRVDLTDVSGYGFDYYPGVDFESDTQGVTVTDEQFFAVLPCSTNETLSNVEIDSTVPSGTEVTITATVMMLNQQCSGTDSVSYKFTVLAP